MVASDYTNNNNDPAITNKARKETAIERPADWDAPEKTKS